MAQSEVLLNCRYRSHEWVFFFKFSGGTPFQGWIRFLPVEACGFRASPLEPPVPPVLRRSYSAGLSFRGRSFKALGGGRGQAWRSSATREALEGIREVSVWSEGQVGDAHACRALAFSTSRMRTTVRPFSRM